MRPVLSFLLTFIVISGSFAEVLPGWEHASLVNPEKINEGVLMEGSTVLYSSPVAADLDLNPENGLEIVSATSDAVVNAVSADGVLLWSTALPNHNCEEASAANKLFSSPAVAALFPDGKQYVVVGYGGVNIKECGGGVVALDGETGKQLWHFDLVRFAEKKNFYTGAGSTVFSSPVVKDINNDGYAEIAFGSYDRNVYVLDADGLPVWYYHAADTVWSSGQFTDINNDGIDELIIGTDITENKYLNPPTENGGYVYAFKIEINIKRKSLFQCKKITKKKRKKRCLRKVKRKAKVRYHGFRDADAYYWQTYLNQTIYSTPVIGDILPDSPGKEIAIGSGCYFPENQDKKNGRWVKILSLQTGKVLQTLNSPVCITSRPLLFDIDQDGKLEVVNTLSGHSSIGGTGVSSIIAWDPERSEAKWLMEPSVHRTNDVWAGHFSSATAADLDQDGRVEVVAANGSHIIVLDGETGEMLSCNEGACNQGYDMFYTNGVIRGTPLIIDINNDDILEIITASKRSYQGTDYAALYGWTGLEF